MFKKGDVVVFTTRGDELVKEDERFVVDVLEDQGEQSHFVGKVTDRGHRATHRIGVTSHYWSAKQFKLKQQDVISNDSHDNAFPVLKDGMIVTTRERGSYLVCGDKLLQPNGYNRVGEYLADGKSNYLPEYDIVKVWSGVSLWSLDFDYYTKNRSDEIIWQENKNAKAVAEIEEQMSDLQQQMSVLEEKLTALREEK